MIAYYRVSTAKQGISGLGLEAQSRLVQQYVASNDGSLLAQYTEIETGKKDALDNRPELKKAIAHAKRSKAVLVVAKLDRLTRSVAVLSLLQTSGIEFVACDNPFANRMTVQILAAVAENEVYMISERTKAALRSLKNRGELLGSARPECRKNLSDTARASGRVKAAQVNHAKKLAAYEDLFAELTVKRDEGASYAALAAYLNESGHTTRRGSAWSPMQVRRVLHIPSM